MSKKQTINIIIALLFSVGGILLLITSSNNNHFIKVENGLGNCKRQINNSKKIEYILQKNGDYQKTNIFNTINSIETNGRFYIGLALAILAMCGRDLGYIIRLQVLSDKKLSWKQCATTVLLWEFSSAISPGTVGGSAVAMFIINKQGISLGKSTSMVFVATLFDNLFYVIIVPIFLLSLPYHQLFPTSLEMIGFSSNIFLFGYAVILIITGIFAYSLFIPSKWINYILIKISTIKILLKWKQKIILFSNNLLSSNKDLKKKKLHFWLKIMSTTFLSWTARFLVINAIIFAFGKTNINDQFLILGKQAIMWIILLITPIPGGSGIAEFMFSTFFNTNNNNEMIITIQSVLWRLISYYPYIIIGIIILPKFLIKAKKKL